MDPELQAFATELTMKIIPEVEGIVEVYKKNAEEGLTAYLEFIMSPQEDPLICR